MRPGSAFLTALNAHPTMGAAHYGFIGGDGWHDRASDALVSVDSALARGILSGQRTATLPLVHAMPSGDGGMPCDPRVYAAIRAWVR